MRKLLTLRWISFDIMTIGFVGLFCILGHWQWDVGGLKRGSIRNYAYGIEWWVFALILIVLWWRLIRQELRESADESALKTAPQQREAPRFRVPAPQVTAQVDDTEDPEMAAYNRYLLSLHEKDLEKDAAGGAA